jgi:CheY-like chemotaxis protein
MPTRPRRVLVVDDDRDIRETLEELLHSAGWEVASAANGREGLEQLQRAAFDLVVLDLMMPVMTGWQFREAQLRDPSVAHVPVIVISAVHPATALDAAAFLPKPFDIDQLLELAARHAGGSTERPAGRRAAREDRPPRAGL